MKQGLKLGSRVSFAVKVGELRAGARISGSTRRGDLLRLIGPAA